MLLHILTMNLRLNQPLIKDGLMRKPDKATLGRLMSKNVGVYEAVDHSNMLYVLDGGSLLHSVRWPKTRTYMDAVECYLNFLKHMRRIYKNMIAVVFDGYESDSSTKDHGHRRRSSKSSAYVTLTDSAAVHPNQQAFLANAANKGQFMAILGRELENAGYDVKQAADDADIDCCHIHR
jgi:hypothetical protein